MQCSAVVHWKSQRVHRALGLGCKLTADAQLVDVHLLGRRRVTCSRLGVPNSGCYEPNAPKCQGWGASAKTGALPFALPPFHLPHAAPKKDPFNPLQTNTALHCLSLRHPPKQTSPPPLNSPTPHRRRRHGRQVHPRAPPPHPQGPERLHARRAPPPPRGAAGRDPPGEA